MINTVTGASFEVEKGESKKNMCKAIDDMVHDAHEEGWQEAWQEGLAALLNLAGMFTDDFEQAVKVIRANGAYENVTEEQVRQFWNK